MPKRKPKPLSPTTMRLEVGFPVPVNFPPDFENKLVDLISKVCTGYEREHPDRVMWPAGMGQKPNFDYTAFDAETYYIEVAERENFNWPCKKCHYSLGNHAHVLWSAPAEDCVYEPADKPSANWRGFYQRMGAMRKAQRARARRFKSRFAGWRRFRAPR